MVVSADSGEWRGPCEGEQGVWAVELGRVAHVFRGDETTKLVNQIEVRFYSLWYRRLTLM